MKEYLEGGFDEKMPRRTYSEEFKKQTVELYNSRKPLQKMVREYELTTIALYRWILRINKTGSTRERDNRSESENEHLARNEITRSLSRPGRPVDNAVSESWFKTLKFEFVRERDFGTLKRLSLQLGDWVHGYNHLRLHSVLNNLSPISSF